MSGTPYLVITFVYAVDADSADVKGLLEVLNGDGFGLVANVHVSMLEHGDDEFEAAKALAASQVAAVQGAT